ncbi:MATE family efflux transporter [Candidatus Dependentiae bacterium]|nr:MATE family efflux transporter [Candidatus Dependentiae bacterium]
MTDKIKEMRENGESTKEIISLWLPELISATMLISLPPLIDSYLVASLKSTTTYGALEMANNFLHLLIKLAEGIPVATIAIIGRHNGAKEYSKCGKDLGDAFWTTTIIGIIFALPLFLWSKQIFQLMGVPTQMATLGAPFLKLRSIGILLTFISLSFFAFLRGIKNTQAPMVIYILGISTFIICDYILVLGKFGFEQMGLTGSAIATIIQYITIITASLYYILTKTEYNKYFSKIFISYFNSRGALKLLNLSWPIILDKGSLAFSYVWLSSMIAPMGKYAIASFGIIKNLERFAILPAVAFAQVITFLVSNRLGAKDPLGAKANIKKVMILTSVMVATTISILCLKSEFFVSFFDQKNKFTHFASSALILVSLLVVFDFIQLILAGALRGAGDVLTVMAARVLCFGLFFTPLAYIFSHMELGNPVIKFALVYGTFYFTTGLLGIIFLLRIKTPKWQKKKL